MSATPKYMSSAIRGARPVGANGRGITLYGAPFQDGMPSCTGARHVGLLISTTTFTARPSRCAPAPALHDARSRQSVSVQCSPLIMGPPKKSAPALERSSRLFLAALLAHWADGSCANPCRFRPAGGDWGVAGLGLGWFWCRVTPPGGARLPGLERASSQGMEEEDLVWVPVEGELVGG